MLTDPGNLPPSNIETDQSPYPFWALERWVRLLVAFLIQNFVGAGASTLVWRPGGVTAGNVYATWAEIVAVVATLNGDITIALDDSLAAAVIPAGNWDLRPAGVTGPVEIVAGSATGFLPFITIANAAVTIHGLTGIRDVSIDNQSTVDVMTAPSGGEIVFYLRGTSAIYQNTLAGGKAFFKVAGGPAAAALLLYIQDFSFISTLDVGINAIQLSASAFSTANMLIQDGSALDTNQLVTGAGSTMIVDVSAVDTASTFGGILPYMPQAGAPTTFPTGMRQNGSTAIVVGTGKTAAIPAFVKSTSRILVSLKTPAGDALTVKYAALGVDRVPGFPGSFQISALVAAGGGAVNGADTSTIDWEIFN